MLLTQTSHYAVSGVLRLASLPPEGFCRVEALVQGTQAPPHAVAKVFHALARRGVLASVRGAGGGYRLSEGALALSLMDVIEAVDGRFNPAATIERGLCLPGQQCPLEQIIGPIAAQLGNVLRATRIGALAGRARSCACDCCPDDQHGLIAPPADSQARVTPGGDQP